jgi:hypothetical protein
MRAQPLFEVLGGQQLTAVLAVEHWGTDLAPNDDQAAWPLYGALALLFETHALLLTSPLRSSRSQQGTRIGLADGSSVSLGLRATLCESEQAAAMVSFRLGMPPAEALLYWSHQELAVAGQRLCSEPVLDLDADPEHSPIWFAFDGGRSYRLQYRRDLDGAIEFAPAGQRATPACIEVTQPKGPLAWLHPDRVTGFVINNQRWRSARQWPIDVRRRLRDADPSGPEVRDVLLKAYEAFFLQNPDKAQRLHALNVPVSVRGLPDGLIAEVRANLGAPLATAPTDSASSVAQTSDRPQEP